MLPPFDKSFGIFKNRKIYSSNIEYIKKKCQDKPFKMENNYFLIYINYNKIEFDYIHEKKK